MTTNDARSDHQLNGSIQNRFPRTRERRAAALETPGRAAYVLWVTVRDLQFPERETERVLVIYMALAAP
jgi:hypothetical protein